MLSEVSQTPTTTKLRYEISKWFRKYKEDSWRLDSNMEKRYDATGVMLRV